ncbi:uncharacterized protein GJ701_006080 isoform 1-T7 [Geothlypis trichas]
MTLPASTRGLNSRRPRPAQAHWDPSHLCRPRPAQAHWDPSHLCRPRPAQAHWDPSHLCRPRPAQAHWDPSHLCRPRPSHLCRLRLRKPRLLPAPLTPIKPGESAPGPLSSGDAGRECCGSVCRSAARRSGSGAAAAWSPRCSGGQSCSGTGAGTEPGAAAPAPAGAELGSRRGSGPWGAGAMTGAGPPEKWRFAGAAPGSRLETGRAGESPCGSPGTSRAPPLPQWRRPPRGAALADTAPLLSPAGAPSPPPSAPAAPRARRLPLRRGRGVRIPLLRVRIPGGSPPSDRGCSCWGRCSRCSCAWRRPEAPEGLPPPYVLGICREELCLQYAEHTSRHGHRDSAGTDPATALPVAPQPGAALNRPRRCFSPDRHRRQPRRTPRSRWHYLGWRHRLFTEGLRQQFLFLTSQSSHTAARYWIPSSMPWKCLKIRNFKQDDVWNCAGSQLEVQK